MTDIVERLLAPSYWISGSDEGHEGDNSAPMEAAAEIERLRAALREIADMIPYAMPDYSHQVWKTARAALKDRT